MTYGASAAQKLGGLFSLLQSLVDFGRSSNNDEDVDELRAQAFPDEYFDGIDEEDDQSTKKAKSKKAAPKKAAPKSKKPKKKAPARKSKRSKSRDASKVESHIGLTFAKSF